MKQDNITEMHIYVKYEILSFMRRQFSSLKFYIKLVKIENKTKTKQSKSRDLHKDCHFDDGTRCNKGLLWHKYEKNENPSKQNDILVVVKVTLIYFTF
jgi:hypothetical protein